MTWESDITHHVETVDVSFVNPNLQSICHLRWCTNKNRSISADAHVFRNCVFRPFRGSRGKASIALNSRPHSIALHVSQFLVVSILPKVNPSPTTKQRQRTVQRRIFSIICKLGLGLFFGATDDRSYKSKEFDVLSIPTEL